MYTPSLATANTSPYAPLARQIHALQKETPGIVQSLSGVRSENSVGNAAIAPPSLSAAAGAPSAEASIPLANIAPKSYFHRYDPAENALSTLRIDGREVEILSVAERSPRADQRAFEEHVRPYVRSGMTTEERCAKAETHLRVEKYTYEDLEAVTDSKRRDCEKFLVGQDKVVARHRLPKGTCVGVLQGEILDRAELQKRGICGCIHYLMPAGKTAGKRDLCILTDGIGAKINTNYKVFPKTETRELSPDEDARRYAQALSGYNLRARTFDVCTNALSADKVTITALFTTEQVEPGTEVRFRYDSSPQNIRERLKRSDPIPRRQ